MKGEKKMRRTKMKVTRILMTVFCLTVLMAVAHDANAQTIRRVRCRTRVNPARAQVVVSVEDLVPFQVVTATITNPANPTISFAATAAANAAGAVDLIFDSQVVAGVTAIPADFAVSNNTVNAVVTGVTPNLSGT